MKLLSPRHLFWSVPFSLGLGVLLAFIQPGNFWVGLITFFFLFLFSFWFFTLLHRWAGGGRTLGWIIALAFLLRLVVGIGVSLLLPVYGYDDPDDRSGFIFTDAHLRDDQAWELAQSGEPILSAFNKTYHTDQYGGLLAFTSLAYRLFSPDGHRPLLLVLLSAIMAALGLPFFWRAAHTAFGGQVALTAGWILAIYPESLLLGSAAMREPYLVTFSAVCLWGFVDWQFNQSRRAWFPPSGMIWLGLGLAGMLLVSPVVALVTLVILAGWLWMTREHGRLSWTAFFAAALVFLVGLVLLAWALNRQGVFSGGPLAVIGAWFNRAVQWDVYQLERSSGWVQKLFKAMPAWARLPFVTVYGVFQPVLPAVFIEPTLPVWRVIGVARALGWYLLWPTLLYALIAAWKNDEPHARRLWFWITTVSWLWIILTALRAGGDLWDNPRYRSILLLWQALASSYAWACFHTRVDSWLVRIWLIEGIFLAFFTQWYLSRYHHLGGQIPFGWMVGLIIGSSLIVLVGGGWWDRRQRRKPVA